MFKSSYGKVACFLIGLSVGSGCTQVPNPPVERIDTAATTAVGVAISNSGFSFLKSPSNGFPPGQVYYLEKVSSFGQSYVAEQELCTDKLYPGMVVVETEESWPSRTYTREANGDFFLNLLGGLLGGAADGNLRIGAANVAAITLNFPSKVKVLEIRQSELRKEQIADRDCALTVKALSDEGKEDQMAFIRAVAKSKDMIAIFTLNPVAEENKNERNGVGDEAASLNPLFQFASFQNGESAGEEANNENDDGTNDGSSAEPEAEGDKSPNCGTYLKVSGKVPGKGGGGLDISNCSHGEWKIVLNDPEPLQVVGFRPYSITELRSNQTKDGVAPFTGERIVLIGHDVTADEAASMKPLGSDELIQILGFAPGKK